MAGFLSGVERVFGLVGARLRTARADLGLAQARVGELLGELLGRPWPRQTVSQAEQGRRPFTAPELVALAKVLRCPVVRLLAPPDDEPVTLPSGATLPAAELAVLTTGAGTATTATYRTVADLEHISAELSQSAAILTERIHLLRRQMDDPEGAATE